MKHTKPSGIIPGLILHRLRRARKPLTSGEIIERILIHPRHTALTKMTDEDIKARITGNLVHLARRGEIVVIKPMGRPRKHGKKRFLYRVA